MLRNSLQKNHAFTSQEKVIAAYFEKHFDEIPDRNAKEFSKEIYVSQAAITRLCKKIGFTGYPAFQKQVIKECTLLKMQTTPLPFGECRESGIPQYLLTMYHTLLDEECVTINDSLIYTIMDLLKKADIIDFYGSDANYSVLENASFAFTGLHYYCHVFNTYNSVYSESLPARRCVSMIVSHSGKNAEMLNVAYALKKQGVFTIALTGENDEKFKNICDLTIVILPNKAAYPFPLLPWTIALTFFLNMMYLCAFKLCSQKK